MTVFDNQLMQLLHEMATAGEIRASAAELARGLDCSTSTVRRAIQRLADDGTLEVIHIPGRGSALRLLGVGEQGEQTTHRYPPPLRGGVGTDEQTTHTSRTPPGPTKTKSTGPQPLPANRNCPRCEGTGLVFVDLDTNIVTDCECRGPDVAAWRRTRQTANAIHRAAPDGPPAKSDYVEVWRRYARHQLTGEPAEVPGDAR